MTIRPEDTENAHERSAIRSIHQAAFEGSEEAGLVDRLWAEGAVLLSLLAEQDSRIVGHILFSRMAIETAGGSLPAAALAPVAVRPEFQRRGIGGQLIRAGLDALRGRGEQVVLVLGHEQYYPRFGFSGRKARLLESPFPPEYFMALELTPGALDGVRGKVRYPAAFGL